MSTGKILLAILLVLLAGVMLWGLVAGIWGLGVATAGLYGRGEAQKQIQSADFRIAAYDSFFNQYGSIKTLESQIDELTAHVASLEPGTTEYSRMTINLLSVKNMRHAAIQKYNADAAKNWTEGQFRDNDLPFQIADTAYPP
jgi:hypothetical protein